MRWRAAHLGALLTLLAASRAVTTAQQPDAAATPAPESLPTIHVTSRLVVLDVVVSDGHGHPGSGLTAPDFKLTEDGVPQTIDTVIEHDAPPPTGSVSENDDLPPNTFTVQKPVTGNGVTTIIVVNHSGRWDDFIHAQLRDYFQNPVTTPTAIFRMDGKGIHLIQGLTTNRKLLVEAATSERIWPPLGPRFTADPASFKVHIAGSPTQRLATYLSSIPGRVNVVWVGGIVRADQVDPDLPDQSSSQENVANMVGSLNRTNDERRIGRIALYSIVIGACGLGALNPSNSNGGRNFYCTFPKQALEHIASTGSHYYTVSYRSTNANWNGAFRRIHLDVANYAQPPLTLRWSQLITGWADDVEPTVMYRQGYFARSTPIPGPALMFPNLKTQNVAMDASPQPAPQRKRLSISPKGEMGPYQDQTQAAMAFATPTPFQMNFTIVATPALDRVKIKPRDDLSNTVLTPPFRDGPYRNFQIHYWIDPQDIHLTRNVLGRYQDDLKIVAVAYRDDGLAANSFATVTHLDVSAEDAEVILASGFTVDRTIAIPTTENFFLRTVVVDESTGHIGAIEIPIEWIKLPPPESIAAKN